MVRPALAGARNSSTGKVNKSMQAKPYLVVEGTVVGHRVVKIEAREPEEFTDKTSGEKRMTRPRPEQSYTEVGVNCPAILDGKIDPDVRAVQTVRWPERTELPERGTVVRWAVEAENLKVYMGGRFREWLVYYHRGDAPERAAEILTTARSSAAA